MTNNTVNKYVAPKTIDLPNRQWPSREVTRSPQFCSVDLRDGNQALPNPLSPEAKLEYFKLLCDTGFKHIEVAFPSASQDDFDFTRELIEGHYIPDDVFIMGLTQSRPHLIERTFEAFAGIPRGIVHTYCATSELHMRQVFNFTAVETMDMVVRSIEQIRDLAAAMPDSDIRLEFSPEEFTDSDPAFVLELCEMIFETWGQATADKPLIFDLPATVERRPPNHYADMIEWFCTNFSQRDNILVSVHSHNDQGMAVAASELTLLAGADRVEGTLFGHGERTGNVDLVTIANNLHARGIDTGLNFGNLDKIAETVERLTGMKVYYRQPYSGDYVFTAFSGSHQDAIRKGLHKLDEAPDVFGMSWKVPYLHIDPADVGREYERLIRINSQSGKGGIAWILETDHHLTPPKAMHPQIGAVVQGVSDHEGRELNSQEVYDIFAAEFLSPQGPFELEGYWPRPDDANPTWIRGEVRMKIRGQSQTLTAEGNGPIAAFVHCVQQLDAPKFKLKDYHEQAVGNGADAVAMAYVPLAFDDGTTIWGVGTDTNIDQAAAAAIVSALNRKLLIG